jgi:hypothetical protein
LYELLGTIARKNMVNRSGGNAPFRSGPIVVVNGVLYVFMSKETRRFNQIFVRFSLFLFDLY